VIAQKNGRGDIAPVAASSDFTEDLRIGQDIIKANVEAYRRLRNTVRFMLANLSGFRRGTHRLRPNAGAGTLHAGQAGRAGCDGRRGYEKFDFGLVNSTLSISAPMTCRPSISTSARTRFIAIPRMPRAAAPPAR